MVSHVLFAMLVLGGEKDAGSIPAEERIAYVNSLADRVRGRNASKYYEVARQSYVGLTDPAFKKSEGDRREAYLGVDANLHALAVAGQWTAEETDLIRKWLTANEKTLAALKQAARRRRYFSPLPETGGRLHSVVVSEVDTSFISLARLEAIAAADWARQGQWDTAYEGNLRTHRLADHAYHERNACWQLLALLERHLPEDLASLLEDIDKGDDLRCPSDLVGEVEALFYLDYVEAWHEWAEEPAKHPDLTSVAELQVGAMDEDFLDLWGDLVGESPFKSVEEVRKAIRSSPIDEERKVLGRLDEIMQRWTALPFHTAWKQEKGLREEYCEAFLKAPSLAVQGCGSLQFSQGRLLAELTRAHRAAVACVTAIHRFRNKVGRLPSKLQELAPEFLDEVPVDPFSGRPLVYRAGGQGTDFTLYSVGADQVDSGAEPASEVRGAGDQVFWPRPEVPRYQP
jgi:hypothetical protein